MIAQHRQYKNLFTPGLASMLAALLAINSNSNLLLLSKVIAAAVPATTVCDVRERVSTATASKFSTQ